MMRTRPTILLIFVCTLLLCSCKSLDRTVDITLGENYYTGSFVRPTTPDKIRVYTDNAPLPLTTEVIGKFTATDPEARRNASLDVLLDTVKKEASYIGANGLFLTEHYKPHWLGYPQHVLHGYLLLQPDTLLRPNREHPLNTAYREALEREEAKKQAEKEEQRRLYPPHKFYLSAGHSGMGYPEDAVVSDVVRSLASGLGLQGSYTYKNFGVLYNGHFARCSHSFHMAPPDGMTYQYIMTRHSVIPIWTLMNGNKGKKFFTHLTVGIGHQWENIYCRAESSNEDFTKQSFRRNVIYYAVGFEYHIHEHWGVEARFHSCEWGVTHSSGNIDKSSIEFVEGGISLGINYHL